MCELIRVSEMMDNMLALVTALLLMIPCQQTISAQTSPASHYNCSQPLGMEDGRIKDAQITASSSYQETLVGPEKETVIIFYSFFKKLFALELYK